MDTDSHYLFRRRVRKMVILAVSLILCVSTFILVIINNSRGIFKDYTILEYCIFVIFCVMASLLMLFSVMEVKEYITHFRNLRDDGFHTHRLSLEKVMDNESRKRIIENVVNNPGIHYNQLRKLSDMHPGQFRWHINVLIEYGIIQKKSHGNHILFYSIDSEDYNSDILLKFPLRESIFEIINKNPGITSSGIARLLDMPNQRNKIKYHVDKLKTANYIKIRKNGRKKELFTTSHES